MCGVARVLAKANSAAHNFISISRTEALGIGNLARLPVQQLIADKRPLTSLTRRFDDSHSAPAVRPILRSRNWLDIQYSRAGELSTSWFARSTAFHLVIASPGP